MLERFEESAHRDFVRFRFDHHSLRRVQDETVNAPVLSNTIDKRPEANTLDDTPDFNSLTNCGAGFSLQRGL